MFQLTEEEVDLMVSQNAMPSKFKTPFGRFATVIRMTGFFIIDDKTVYHFGASLKDLGKKWFAFLRMDKEAFNPK